MSEPAVPPTNPVSAFTRNLKRGWQWLALSIVKSEGVIEDGTVYPDSFHDQNMLTAVDGVIETVGGTPLDLTAAGISTRRNIFSMNQFAATDMEISTTTTTPGDKIYTGYVYLLDGDKTLELVIDLLDGDSETKWSAITVTVGSESESAASAKTSSDKWTENITVSVDVSALSGKKPFTLYLYTGDAGFTAKARRGVADILSST